MFTIGYLYKHEISIKTVSIIITTYKHQDFIANTIESILCQTYVNWELLIGDDSPDDNTWDIIQQYILKYPDKINARHNQPNKGIVENINFLLSQISRESEYIAFLEWDDLYRLDNLSKKIKIFQQYPEVRLVYNELDFINSKWETLIQNYLHYRKIPFFQNTIINTETFIQQTTWPIVCRSTGMIQRSVLSNCKVRSVDERKKSYQVSDYDFYFQIATNYHVYGIQEPLTYYRRHENNLSWSNGWTSEDLEKLIYYYYKNKIISEDIYNKKMSWVQIVYSFFALERGEKKEWFRSFKQSFAYNKTRYLIYKLFLFIIFLLPTNFWKQIIKKLIRRN